MGTFAETAYINYSLSFAYQRKQTSVFRFCLQQTNGSLPLSFAANNLKLPFSFSSVFVYILVFYGLGRIKPGVFDGLKLKKFLSSINLRKIVYL
jgi:hypothetical protein